MKRGAAGVPWQIGLGEVELVQPVPARELPLGRGWRFELKYDGFRLLAEVKAGSVQMRYRRGDASAAWPEIAAALSDLNEDLVVDGEIVVPDPAGRPQFDLVQSRSRRRGRGADLGAHTTPALYCVFDLLALGRRDLRPLPQEARKHRLREILGVAPPRGLLFVDDCGDELAKVLLERSREVGEGVVAKDPGATYRAGSWIKIRHNATSDVVLVGLSIGDLALHVAAYAGDRLQYLGRVTGGITRRQIQQMASPLAGIVQEKCPCADTASDAAEMWFAPRVVVEVDYAALTSGGLLRHAEFIRVREDKPPEDCLHPLAPAGKAKRSRR